MIARPKMSRNEWKLTEGGAFFKARKSYRFLIYPRYGVDALQVNDAGCGLAHWLCAAPRAVAGARGEALLPLLAWLEGRLGAATCGSGKNGVGHAPCHKAAFLGHGAVVDGPRGKIQPNARRARPRDIFANASRLARVASSPGFAVS